MSVNVDVTVETLCTADTDINGPKKFTYVSPNILSVTTNWSDFTQDKDVSRHFYLLLTYLPLIYLTCPCN